MIRVVLYLPDARFTGYYAENERHLHFIPRVTLSGNIAGGFRYNIDARRTVGVGGVNSLCTGWLRPAFVVLRVRFSLLHPQK